MSNHDPPDTPGTEKCIWSIISAVLGFVSFFPCYGFLLAPVAIILGLMALRIERENSYYSSKGFADAEITLAALSLPIHLALFVMGYISRAIGP